MTIFYFLYRIEIGLQTEPGPHSNPGGSAVAGRESIRGMGNGEWGASRRRVGRVARLDPHKLPNYTDITCTATPSRHGSGPFISLEDSQPFPFSPHSTKTREGRAESSPAATTVLSVHSMKRRTSRGRYLTVI